MGIKFTGEVFVPGKTPRRITEDHLERYRFASQYVYRKKVLDIACGTGYGSYILAEAGASSVEGVDTSEDLITYARSHYRKDNLDFKVGDACTLTENSLYDAIISFETLEHVENYTMMLQNLQLLLRKGGFLILSTPNRLVTSPESKTLLDKPKNKFHRVEFTVNELLATLTASGFCVDQEVFGQRYRRAISSAFLRKIHKKLFRPDYRTSPRVKVCPGLMQRYIVIVAKKE